MNTFFLSPHTENRYFFGAKRFLAEERMFNSVPSRASISRLINVGDIFS